MQTTSAVHFDPLNSLLFADASAAALRRMQPATSLRVLDLGCGTGIWGLLFASLAAVRSFTPAVAAPIAVHLHPIIMMSITIFCLNQIFCLNRL